jgi:glycosyltransferase involved in cell wall biosynthesis
VAKAAEARGVNVLLAVHHFPPQYWGGGELRAYEMARWLLAHGHTVRVIAVESISDGDGQNVSVRVEKFEGIPVHRLSFHLQATPDPFQYSYDNPLIGAYIQSEIARDRPDLFHLIGGYLQSASALDAARAQQVPTLLTLLEFWFLCPVNILMRGDGSLCEGPSDLVDCARCVMDDKRRYRLPDVYLPSASRAFWHAVNAIPAMRRVTGLEGRINRLRERRDSLHNSLLQTDRIISPSDFARDVFIANGIPREKILVLGHVENTPPLTHRWDKIPSDRLRIGYLGQIIKMKGVDVLLNAFMRLCPRGPSPLLYVYGNMNTSPPFSNTLKAIAGSNPNVVFAGTYDREQVYEVLAGLDVLVFPSVWYENAPRVIREAFETGTPVVATNLGSAAEYVRHDENGLLFERGSPASLARQLQRLVDEPDLVSRLRTGIPRVKPLDQEMRELLDVYEKTIAGTA